MSLLGFQPTASKRHMVVAWILVSLLVLVFGSWLVQRKARPVAAASPNRATQPTQMIKVDGFPEPLVPVGQAPSLADEQVLRKALATLKKDEPDQLQGIETYLQDNPNSPWAAALWLNCGLVYHKTGHLTHCLSALRKAWELSSSATEPKAKAVGDRALGELAITEAYLGHYDQLKILLDLSRKRNIGGAATELLTFAREGYQEMMQHPERSFLCGPCALARISKKTGHFNEKTLKILEGAKSTRQGTSLLQVRGWSKDLGLDYQMAYRSVGAQVLTPAVVHLRVGHFAALLPPGSKPFYRLEDSTDSTQGDGIYMTQSTLDEEASGYFLVPAGKLPQGWRPVTEEEGQKIWGRGNPGNNKASGATSVRDVTIDGPKKYMCSPMTTWDVHAMLVSLSLKDTPVGTSPSAFALPFTVYYSQRDAGQPANFSYTNFGPKWTCNWISIVTDKLATSTQCSVYERGGGVDLYNFATTYSGQPGNVSDPGRFSHAILTKISDGSGTRFVRRFPDGSQEIYGLASGDQYFMTQTIDAQGNTTSINWDSSQMRIQSITDAVGRVTTLSYESSDPLKVTRVTDPFGRSAVFTYLPDGHLGSVTDILGIVSSYQYGQGDFIKALTTPYGTTNFSFEDATTNPDYDERRVLNITDAVGRTSRVEYVNAAPGIPYIEQPSPAGVSANNPYHHNYRNSYYWEPQQLAGGLDYTKAIRYHFGHNYDLAPIAATGRTLELYKEPLKNAVWYVYPGYVSTLELFSDQPIEVAQVQGDGRTKVQHFTYNAQFNVASQTDPEGRQYLYQYAPNGIDVTGVTVGGQSLMSATYDANHNVTSLTGASGGTSTFSYNTRGQVTSTTNELGETTAYTYTPEGDLTGVQAPLGANTTFARDNVGRVTSATDTEGRTVQATYDAADRALSVTYPDGTKDLLEYTRLDLTATTDRLGRRSSFQFDPVQRLTQVVDPNGGATDLAYGDFDQPLSLSDPSGRTTLFSYDLIGRLASKQYAGGATELYSYYPCCGFVRTITDALGHSKTLSYNLDSSVKGITYSGTTPPVSFDYDTLLPRVVSMTDGVGTTAYSYGAIGAPGANKVTGITGPYGDTASFAFDVAGRPKSQIVNGSAQNVTFDELWRPTSTTNALDTFNMTYLGKTGQVTGVNSTLGPSASFAYGTNAQDRRLTQIKNLGRSGSALSQFDFQYDAVGQITQITDTVGTATNTTGGGGDCHDKCCHKGKCCHKDKCCKRKCCKGKGECGKERCHQKHDRDDDDDDRFGAAPFDLRILNGLLGLAIASLWGAMFWQFARRQRATTSRLAQVTSLALISALALNGCIFSGSGTTTTTSNVLAFNYDSLGQLIGVKLNGTAQETYSFDPSGNLTSLTTGTSNQLFSYNSLNQQTSPAGQVFDAKGQTTTTNGRTYEWDDQGRLTAVVVGTQRSEFGYNGASQRTKITEFTNGTVTSKKLYFWLGGSIVCERDGLQTGFPITKQYFGQGEVRGTTKLYYATDHLGSIRELVDSTGAVRAEYSYSTYGEQTKVSGDLDSDWGWSGLWNHKASGLYLATFRAYDSVNKRWISRDPLGEGVDANLYRYCGNSPINRVDPGGLFPLLLVEAAVTLAEAAAPLLAPISGEAIAAGGAVEMSPLAAGGGVFLSNLLQDLTGGQTVTREGGPRPETHWHATCPDKEKRRRDKRLYRFGRSWESRGRLERKSAEAKASGFPYGVSTSERPSPDASSATVGELESAGFGVHHTRTGNDPTHHTVEFGEPVSTEQAALFNKVFGRTR